MNTQIKMIAIIGALATLSWQALAQQDAPATPFAPLLPISLTPIEQPTPIEKVIDPGLNDAIPAPLPQWDGEKPFMPELHAPQFPAATLSEGAMQAFKPAAKVALRLSDADVQELRMINQPMETLIAVRLPEGERIVRLSPYSMRSPEAKLMVQVEGGFIVEEPWPEPTTYRGTIDGMEADVAASIKDGKVSMLILPRDPAQPTWLMQPLDEALPGMPAALHVVYRQSDVLPTNARCGMGDDGIDVPAPVPPMPDGGHNGITGDEGGIAVANIRCQIAMDADYEYYQACGSSVLGVIYEMERMMNHTGLIYQGQVAISYTESFIIVRTAVADPYNTGLTGSGMRDEFRNWWVANHAGVTRDVALLFSNRSSTDGFIGFAYFAGICNNNNSANSGHTWASTFWSATLANKVATVAHELGHEWNASHCDGAGDCGLMNSSITGSWSFDSVALASVIAHRDSRPCLDVWQNPTYVNNTWAGAETGSISNPWNTIFEGLDACLVGGTLIVQGGNYLQNPNIFKAKNIQAVNGIVRIGN